MDREKLQTFISAAEIDLASIRSSLLIVAQSGDVADLAVPRRNLARLRLAAIDNDRSQIAEQISACETAVKRLADEKGLSASGSYMALDLLSKIEAAIWEVPMESGEFLADISGFVDASFNHLMPNSSEPVVAEPEQTKFEIDDETLDIFRSEADELLLNITNNIAMLWASPGDQNALWDIRRNAHTFKGAAGIVGLKDASEIAHMMEDLLDKLVELRRDPVPEVIDFLAGATERLKSIVASRNLDADGAELEQAYKSVLSQIERRQSPEQHPANGDSVGEHPSPVRNDVKATTTPIVRVSLERLDELIKVSRSLAINRSAIAERFEAFRSQSEAPSDSLAKLDSLFEAQRWLTDEIQSKLLRIRMVKFGNLETRLNRAVHLTCVDENKKAVVEIENGEVEIDTQIIDALVEPLLHLLKNAVVHGIESPETRRLIGKPERGTIRICLQADSDALILSVSDDGNGISVSRLKEKAVSNGILDAAVAAEMSERDAMKLVFDRGLTTAEKIDLNSGRGVGMSIVKESIENRGGAVKIESEPQKGTKFSILMPLSISKPERKVDEPEVLLPATETPTLSTPIVLIVDDSASVRRHSTTLVENAGLRVITADNGAEALELLLSGNWTPDLILSDVEMPQIDGWAFLEYVKTDDIFGKIPVVMVTSLESDENRQKAIDLGASDYLVKPLSEASLQKVLEIVGLTVGV